KRSGFELNKGPRAGPFLFGERHPTDRASDGCDQKSVFEKRAMPWLTPGGSSVDKSSSTGVPIQCASVVWSARSSLVSGCTSDRSPEASITRRTFGRAPFV